MCKWTNIGRKIEQKDGILHTECREEMNKMQRVDKSWDGL